MNNNKTFKVLSLDGGGIKGYLSAKILANIEQYLNNKDGQNIPVGQRFDLIAGTSTGGIIALGLAVGKYAYEIADFYNENIPLIFGKPNSFSFFQPKYSTAKLEEALEKILEDRTLKDIKYPNICITAVDVENAQLRLYKSQYLPGLTSRLNEKLVDIALATSAAPTFFKSHSSEYMHNFVDGGICANNPSMIAFVDAMRINGHNLDNIRMLSVGTGEQGSIPYNSNKLKNAGIAGWAQPVIELVLESQSNAIHKQVEFLLTSEKYLRINPKLKQPVKLDDFHKLDSLKNLHNLHSTDWKFIDDTFIRT